MDPTSSELCAKFSKSNVWTERLIGLQAPLMFASIRVIVTVNAVMVGSGPSTMATRSVPVPDAELLELPQPGSQAANAIAQTRVRTRIGVRTCVQLISFILPYRQSAKPKGRSRRGTTDHVICRVRL